VQAKIIVQKYGGSSVADEHKIRAVAQLIKSKADLGFHLVVVVSAMGDTTDDLLQLAKKVSLNPPRRELDMLLTCGERISMALMSMALQDLGSEAISFTGSQSGIITDDSHAQARIVEVRPGRIEEELAKGKIVIVAGYQGVSRNKEITTLGRGGSDTTAVALAAALGADCEIYSDVDGIFSADPRVVVDAKKLETIGYDEMQELAAAGAKVMNAQAVQFAKEKGIVIHAKSTHSKGTGTAIGQYSESKSIKGVTSESEIWILKAQAANDLLSFIHQFHLKARHVFSFGDHWVAVIPLQDVHSVSALKSKIPQGIILDETLATVTCVGAGLDSASLKKIIGLGEKLHGIYSSSLQVTLIVSRASAKDLTQKIHALLIG
jgi:aspartate kinase